MGAGAKGQRCDMPPGGLVGWGSMITILWRLRPGRA